MMAKEALRKLGNTNHHVLDADIRNYFGNIDHDKLMKLVGMRISDRRVLKLEIREHGFYGGRIETRRTDEGK